MMTKKRIIQFAPVIIAAALFLTAIVIALALPHNGVSDFVSDAARTAVHG